MLPFCIHVVYVLSITIYCVGLVYQFVIIYFVALFSLIGESNELERERSNRKQKNITFIGAPKAPLYCFQNRFLYGFMFVYQRVR